MTIYRAVELYGLLMAALAEGPELELELGQVSEVDSAGIQLLLLAKRTASSRGKQLRLLNHSPALIDVLELLNLTSYFADPICSSAGSEKRE